MLGSVIHDVSSEWVSNFLSAKFEGGLNLLHEADDDAVIWLEATATAALTK